MAIANREIRLYFTSLCFSSEEEQVFSALVFPFVVSFVLLVVVVMTMNCCEFLFDRLCLGRVAGANDGVVNVREIGTIGASTRFASNHSCRL